MTVKEHYENHLACFYSWMMGDFNKGKDAFKDFCITHEVKPFNTGIAIDLGAGTGIQSIALGEIGFDVKSVDFNKKLLSELKTRIGKLHIELIEDDIKNVRKFTELPVDLIICCGDTISHLETFEQLDELIKDCYDLLRPGGNLILSFRDYSIALSDTQRFIPVKSDDKRILTCIIDYSEDKITVTDLLHENNKGTWTQKISSYDKLRIRSEYFINRAETIGFTVDKNENINRMIHLILKK